jgi:hypothetical protein
MQSLIAIEFTQLEGVFHASRIQLGELLVNGDRLHHEAALGVGFGDLLEAVSGFAGLVGAGVQIAHRVQHRQVAGVVLEDLLIVGDGLVQPALLQVALGGRQNLRLVESET